MLLAALFPSTLPLSVPVPEQLSQIQGTVMWMQLVLQLWHDLQKSPHLWDTPLLQFCCFALVRLWILRAHWYQQDVHETSVQFPHARTILVLSQELPDHQLAIQLKKSQKLCLSTQNPFVLLPVLEKLLLFSSRGGKNRNFWRQLWHLGSIPPL